MKLFKKEKDLLLRIAETTMGAIGFPSAHIDLITADKLVQRGLLKHIQAVNLFPYDLIYYTLTQSGWNKVDLLKN